MLQFTGKAPPWRGSICSIGSAFLAGFSFGGAGRKVGIAKNAEYDFPFANAGKSQSRKMRNMTFRLQALESRNRRKCGIRLFVYERWKVEIGKMRNTTFRLRVGESRNRRKCGIRLSEYERGKVEIEENAEYDFPFTSGGKSKSGKMRNTTFRLRT